MAFELLAAKPRQAEIANDRNEIANSFFNFNNLSSLFIARTARHAARPRCHVSIAFFVTASITPAVGPVREYRPALRGTGPAHEAAQAVHAPTRLWMYGAVRGG